MQSFKGMSQVSIGQLGQLSDMLCNKSKPQSTQGGITHLWNTELTQTALDYFDGWGCGCESSVDYTLRHTGQSMRMMVPAGSGQANGEFIALIFQARKYSIYILLMQEETFILCSQ